MAARSFNRSARTHRRSRLASAIPRATSWACIRNHRVSETFLETWWLGPLVWVVLYVSDYSLTIASARLYRAQDKIVLEGSYEITPMFQADVDALRRVSPRFVIILIVSTVYLCLVQALSRRASGFSG